MNPVWLAITTGVGGTLLGSLASYFGPLQLQRRKEHADQRQADETFAAEAISTLAEIRVTTAMWLETLRTTVQNLEVGQFIDLEKFTEKVAAHKLLTRTATSDIINQQVYLQSRQSDHGPYQEFLAAMRDLEASLRTEIAGQRRQRTVPLGQQQIAELQRQLEKAERSRVATLDAIIKLLEKRNGMAFDRL
ncbi:hypothetical protein [Streptomyces sp. NPDC059479]|uniref:hypothetical protein n=1 Tax=Streptomyces sp. NPDC059479 TaxID=3346848 RepID=UPI0036974907